jgi:two-component system cell cycle response regulator
MLDIDYFKKVNDTYGHSAGDQVLRRLGEGLRTVLRETNVPGRIGGEEFAVLMPDTDIDTAAEVAERLRLWVAGEQFQIAEGDTSFAVTVSLGVAQLDGASATVSDLLEKADKALYRAKHEGRNLVRKAD